MHTVLEMEEIEGEHNGENLALSVYKVLDDYQIKSKVSFFIMDNASNNDTFIKSLSALLLEDSISYNSVFYCLHCNEHIINLSVQAFLFNSLSEVSFTEESFTEVTDEQLII
jgi:hypothetical protein